MNALVYLGKIVLETLVAVAAMAALFWSVHYLRQALHQRQWALSIGPVDPVQTEVWDLLAEARQITEEAAS